MLFHHAHVVDGHAAVHGLAHVVDGEQGHLHGGEGFHLHAGGADGFHRCSTKYADSAQLVCAGSFESNSNAGQRQRVAQRNEVAGFLGRHDAGDTGDAQHIAFLAVPASMRVKVAGSISMRPLAMAMRYAEITRPWGWGCYGVMRPMDCSEMPAVGH